MNPDAVALGAPSVLPRIVAVGFKRINKMLQELAPLFANRATVDVLDMGFEQAVARVREMHLHRPIDVVVAAGSNGGYLRQHLDTPVVLVKVGGFDVLQALAMARRVSTRIGLVTYEGMAPDLTSLGDLLDLDLVQQTYRTEEEAHLCVKAMHAQGVSVLVGPGLVADLADQMGLTGIFLYSINAVSEALEDAVEVARASRIEGAKRERLNTILAQLSDGVIAVDRHERIETLNPAMAHWLGIEPGAWLGRKLSDVCPDLSLLSTLRLGVQDIEKIERIKGKAIIANRMPIIEQGVLTGAVLSCQDPISIQRVDRHIRTRIKPNAPGTRYELSQFLGSSPAVEYIQQTALSCARSHASVLLMGESGTGKELIAQGIHMASDRRDMPFIPVNCAAVSETLLESELFGYEDGAFTGARRGGKIGLFEAAHNGSLFLDEIGEMPVALQARLLRVLQEREVLRVGATEPTPVNVRVIAATHQDLMGQVDRGLFRLDLYHRLNILRLDVPPLRDRADDITLIAAALHSKLCHRLSLEPSATQPLLSALVTQSSGYAWPGNVRELENIIERMLAYAVHPTHQAAMDADQARIFLQRVAPELFGSPNQASPQRAPRLKALQAQAEQAEIRAVLAACGGDKAQASQRLGISRTTLWRKLKGES
ncbi:MAG: propionate catabolism operon regulatory protein PrpR [Aquabacterium sp.]|nr:propionate catabolism operon regulatory protein PrpR [Aquabacterium sp.]